jgi:catechol 2,3-dioxygenase-like lactoylglutathione lyase family enzyme
LAPPPEGSSPQIVVQNLERARDFFVQTFGFQATPIETLHGDWVDKVDGFPHSKALYTALTLDNSSTHIELLQYIHPAAPPTGGNGAPNRPGYRHIGLNVDDIDAMYERLLQQWHFFSEVQTVVSFKCKTVYFLGPEDILIQLTQPL